MASFDFLFPVFLRHEHANRPCGGKLANGRVLQQQGTVDICMSNVIS